ncbi:MAG: hypothetical protein ABSF61_11305 [Anaerolineales bacterium]
MLRRANVPRGLVGHIHHDGQGAGPALLGHLFELGETPGRQEDFVAAASQ